MQKGFIFDLDGTVYVDNNLIDGAVETIRQLRDRGDKVVFLTNKSIETIDAYVEKLNGLGIKVEKKDVVNSNLLTAKYLSSRLKTGEKVFVIGEEPLYEELINQGIPVTDSEMDARYVVLGWDRQFNYEKLNKAFQAWNNGAEVVATNPDRTCPVEGGQIPDCGAMIGAMEGATGETIETILGKPNPFAAKLIVEEILQLPSEDCYMIGDRLETDIRMGNSQGMQSVLVLTGITKRDMLEVSSDQPKYVLNSISEIQNIIEDPSSKALDYQQK